ncbi:hypothetical protein [Methylacidimicrobium cyclopophantes]|uniref:hypothetical protein n=1 Tax=Methylacidimicrobium cyclopophantes TaxID=1041766 RepID=UPI00115B4AB2|nr:hypothetical protein [Methylacidimicrobium cyclopophantes]
MKPSAASADKREMGRKGLLQKEIDGIAVFFPRRSAFGKTFELRKFASLLHSRASCLDRPGSRRGAATPL